MTMVDVVGCRNEDPRARSWGRIRAREVGRKGGLALALIVGMLAMSTRARADDSPSRIAEAVWYARLGVGGVLPKKLTIGPAVGFGLRYERDRFAVDISAFNFMFAPKDGTFDDPNGSWARLGLIYFFNPGASCSFYGGGGIGWGVTGVEMNGTHYTSSGVDLGLSLGYEMLRTRAGRLFVQLDADLPTYPSHGYVFDQNSMTGPTRDSIYTPSFGLSVGVGFGKPRPPPPEDKSAN